MAPTTMRLYQVLGVSQSASQDEVKKSYHKLAQRFHPDRQTAEANAERFKEIQAAYEVLGNEQKRATYDRYGDKCLRFIHEREDLVMLGGVNPGVMLCFLLMALLMVVLFVTFIAVKVDGKVSWSWGVVFIPAWVWDAGLMLIAVANLSMFRKSENKIQLVASCAQMVCLVVFSILLCLKLEKVITGAWAAVFSPFFGSMLLDRIFLVKMTKTTFHQHLYVPVFFLLLVLRLDRVITVSYVVVAIPLWVALGLALFGSCGYACYLKKKNPEGAEQQDPGAMACSVTIMVGVFTTVLLLILLKADGAGMTLAEAFIPIFIILGLLTCSSCCLCMCFLGSDPMDDGEEIPVNTTDEFNYHQNPPPADDKPHDSPKDQSETRSPEQVVVQTNLDEMD